MTRPQSLFIALLLTATLLPGCGNGESSTGPTPIDSAAATQAQPLQVGKATLAAAENAQAADFLPVDQAFRIDTNDEGNEVVVVWSIAPDYYLYRHKFRLAWLPDQGERVELDDAAQFSRGLGKVDDYFGHVEVYYHQALARIPAARLGSREGQLEVQYQGCADAGLCYPVQTRLLTLD